MEAQDNSYRNKEVIDSLSQLTNELTQKNADFSDEEKKQVQNNLNGAVENAQKDVDNADKILAGFTIDPNKKAEKAYQEQEINQRVTEMVAKATSFEELEKTLVELDSEPDSGLNSNRSELYKKTIGWVRNGENALDIIPNRFGLREKVVELMQKEKPVEEAVVSEKPQILQNPVLPTKEDILAKPAEVAVPIETVTMTPEKVISPENQEQIKLIDKVIEKATVMGNRILERSSELAKKGEHDQKLTNKWTVLDSMTQKLNINKEKLANGDSNLEKLDVNEQSYWDIISAKVEQS